MMRRMFSPFLVLLMVLLVGCGVDSPALSTPAPSPSPIIEPITTWPDNEDTRGVPRPIAGTPDVVIRDESAGYYSISLRDITREQGEQYVSDLKEYGFREIAGSGNSVSAGYLLQKGEIVLSVALSSNGLGILISRQAG